VRIEVEILGLPPKKDGANSMWAKEAEVPRLVALRRAVADAAAGRRPLNHQIHLELETHLPEGDPRLSGDLDNQITGICDGLMAAHPRIKTHPRWEETDVADIRPDRIVGLVDDSQVVQIRARRVVDASSPWYRLILEGEII